MALLEKANLKSHSGTITCIHNSGCVKSDRDDLGRAKTPNTPEKFYFPRVSALILHSQGQITITVAMNADTGAQHTNHSSPLQAFAGGQTGFYWAPGP